MPVLTVLLTVGALSAAPPRGRAQAAVHQALEAVEGDSASIVRARWDRALRGGRRDRVAVLGLAVLDALTYDYDRADSLCHALLDEGTRDSVAAWAALTEGAIRHRKGDLDGAGEWYARARAIGTAVGDRPVSAWGALQFATSRTRVDGPTVALAMLDSARQLVPAGDWDVTALYHCDRAAILAQRADPASRREALMGARFARRAGERRREAICLHVVAASLWATGQADSAAVILAHVCDLLARARDRATLAGARQWRGSVLKDVAHDYGAARRELLAAVDDARVTHSADPLGWASTDLAEIALALGDLSAASRYVSTALSVFPATNDGWGLASARVVAGTLAAEMGDTATARSRYREAIAWAERSHTPFDLVRAHRGLARVAMRQSDWRTANRELDSCVALARTSGVSGAADAGLASDRATAALLHGELDSAESLLTTTLATLGPADHVWRYRVRTLLADAAVRRGDVARAGRQLAAAEDELDAWRSSLSDAELRVLVFQWRDAPLVPEDGVARVVAGVAAAGRVREALGLAERRRARELRDELVRAAIVRGDAGAGLRPTEDAWQIDVAAALPDGTAAIEYVTGVGSEPTTVFTVTPTDVRAVIIAPADSFAAAVERFAGVAESGGDVRPMAERLGSALLAPAVAGLPPSITRLVVVPDGPLHRLPFDALVTGGRYVVERYAVSLAPSLGALALLRRRPAARSAPAILAFGDPRFGDGRDSPGDAYRSAFDSAGGLMRLPESAREARLVARYAPRAVVRLRDAASEAYLRHAPLASYSVVHFATHALVDEWAVTRTALALTPGAGEDGFVYPSELAALRLDADMVVLSACRTAGGVVVGGEGVRGLAVPLLSAGARSVIATAWRIDDRATVALVRDLYDALAAGAPVTEALQRARLAALDRGAPAAEWAVFSVTGDPGTRVRLSAPR